MAGRTTSKIVLGLLIAVVIGTLLAACHSSVAYGDFVDQSLITGDPCEPPCWYGIEPGIEESEAYEILQDISFVDSDTIEFVTHDSIYHWRYSEPFSDSGGALIIENEKVVSIHYGLPCDLTLAEVIETYDVPSWLHINIYRQSGGPKALVTIAWPRNGFHVQFSEKVDRYSTGAEIYPDTLIELVTYFEPYDGSMETLVEDAGADWGQYEQFYYEWTGYGHIDFK
ncbi:MAG: hypothetical protein JXJ17_00330 [Anaerolineae bacterium]|nr:hypothetical protein [Anaerolineae bacterium]